MRTAIYVRVAVHEPKEQSRIEERPLIKKQLDRLREHMIVRGEVPAEKDIFPDEGYSGGTLDRPALNYLRALVSIGTYERVLVTSPDRLAREHTQLRALIEDFERGGCRVDFLK